MDKTLAYFGCDCGYNVGAQMKAIDTFLQVLV